MKKKGFSLTIEHIIIIIILITLLTIVTIMYSNGTIGFLVAQAKNYMDFGHG